MEQYLVDGVLYQKIPDKNNHANWVRASSADTPDVSKFMQTVKNAQAAQFLLPDEIHKSAQVKLEDAEVNGTNVHKITYEGQLTDLSVLLDQLLPATLSEEIGNSEYQFVMDIIKQSFNSVKVTEVFYVEEDNLVYGTELSINIDCKDAADTEDVPVESIVITASTDNYKYNDISIDLPLEAKEAH